MIDEFIDCGVCGEELDLDEGSSYLVASNDDGRPYDLVCREHDLDDIFAHITLVDGRLVDADNVMLGEWLDARRV